jgi:hypothetical protein
MVDMTAITGLATSIRTAVDITKAMKDLHDANLLQTKTFELTREIMAAQSYAMEAVAAQTALLQQIRDLEAEKTKLEAWETEKHRYELEDVGRGSLAYVIKEAMRNGEPLHKICATCYQHGIKSILQPDSDGWSHLLKCPECKTVLKTEPIKFAALPNLSGR